MENNISITQEQADGSLKKITLPAAAAALLLASDAEAQAALLAEYLGGGSYILKSASFTAEVGKSYALDTTAGSFDVTLPAAPTEGQEVCFCDARGTWNTHAPKFLRNGNKIEAQEINFTDSAQGTFFCAVFIDSTTGWRILESGTKPQNLTVPTVGGNFVGATLTSTPGTWTGSPTSYSYQWQISDDGSTGWSDISGATNATYVPVSGDDAKFVRINVTAINSNGSSLPASSLASAAIETSAFPAGAVAHWRLNETSGVRVDATGNGYDLTDNNGVGYGVGVLGNAADFDGTNYLSATVPATGTNAFSISTWFNLAGFTTGKAPIVGWMTGGFGLMANNSGTLHVVQSMVYDIGDAYSEDAVAEEWVHAVVVRDSDDFLVYINGILCGTLTYSVEFTSTDFRFCSEGSNNNFNIGLVDSTTIFGRTLSSGEVTTLFNGGIPLDYPA